MATQIREARVWRSIALFSTGALITLACTRVKVSWDQAASAAAPAGPTAALVGGSSDALATAGPPGVGSGRAVPEDPRGASRTFSQVAAQLSPSVVSIRVEKKVKLPTMRGRGMPFHPFSFPFGGPDEDGMGGDEDQHAPTQRGAGSGVVIDEKGFVLTNNHVVEGADSISVLFLDGKELKAKVVGTDKQFDLAVISVDTKNYPVKAARLGDSEKLQVGEWVLAIGNPFGLDHTVTVGVISAKGRAGVGDGSGGGTRYYQDFLQTDASINPGNSGGPLVNLAGEVIGINTAILGPGGNIGIGFAVPSEMAKPVAKELIAVGKVRRPYLGLSMQEYSAELAKAMRGPEKGALVQQLTKGAPAEKAGVRRGDVLTKVDDKPILTSRDVQRQVLTHRVGDAVRLEVWRDGKTVSLSAQTEELPGEASGPGAAAPGKDADPEQHSRMKLGMGLQSLTPQLAEQLGLRASAGALIKSVKPGSPAAEAGLARGDVILEVDKHPVSTADLAARALATERQGGHVLLVQRGDAASYILIRPGDDK